MPRILERMPAGARLVEPFVGSAAVYLNAGFARAMLCDVNRDLILVYASLLELGQEFIAGCRSLFVPAHNTRAAYLALRAQFNELPPGPERARIFVYLNRHGYNGLIRYNKSGLFNVPFGRYARPFFPEPQLRAFLDRQARSPVELLTADFRETFARLEPGDVVYADPPYSPLSSTANFTSYWENVFTAQDQLALAALAAQAAKRGIPVIISNHDTEITRNLYRDAQIVRFAVRRAISCQKRGQADELLALYY